MTHPLLQPRHLVTITWLTLAGLSAGAQTLPAADAAQDAAAAVDKAAPGEARQLETVTVTAERRTTNAKNVPMSVSVLRSEVVDTLRSSGDTVITLSARTPSVNAESSMGRVFPRFYIRGYGNTDFQVNSSQPVSLVYDDVVQENAYLKGFPAFDIAQVEVLRGPQGTLFGRNSPAGVIKFDSVKPRRQAEGYVSATYGNLGTANVEAVMNTPLNDDWATRISLLSQHRDNWVRNDNAAGPTQDIEGHDDRALRAQALYAPGGGFTALFNMHAREMKGSQRLFRANAITPGTNDLVPGFDVRRTAIDAVNVSRLNGTGGSARLTWALGNDHALHAITGYESLRTFARGDIDGGISAAAATPATTASITPFPSETSAEMPDLRQLSQELRIESRYTGPLNWQSGLYAFDERYHFTNNDYNSTAGNALVDSLRFRQHTRSAAVFGSVNYQSTPRLKLQAGLRHTRDTKSFATESMQGLTVSGPTAADPRDGKLSWDVSGTYALDAATTLYARAANAYRATSVQPPSAFAQLSVAKPETNTSIEAGLKADLFDRRARLSLAVFDYEVKDKQLSVIGGSSNANTLINARKARGRGAELDLQALLSDNFVVTVGGSYNRTRIDDPGLRVAACGNGCTVTDPVVTPVNPALGQFSPIVSIDGNPLPQAPLWMANLTAKYTLPTASGEWYVFTDWAYRSKMNLFLYESIEFTAKSSLEGGLRVGYRWDSGKYELAGFVRNLTNQTRITGAVDFNNLTAMVSDPRTFGAQLRVLF